MVPQSFGAVVCASRGEVDKQAPSLIVSSAPSLNVTPPIAAPCLVPHMIPNRLGPGDPLLMLSCSPRMMLAAQSRFHFGKCGDET